MPRALVVDDERDARDFVRAILEGEGWKVSEAADGEEGLERARAAPPDLIILDVQMPKKSGFAVFAELAQDPATRSCKVVMLTGVREKTGLGFSGSDMGEFLGREPEAYVEKPIDPEVFKRVVRRVLPA